MPCSYVRAAQRKCDLHLGFGFPHLPSPRQQGNSGADARRLIQAKRASEIITELEPHPRGLYTGAIGWFGFDGRSQWNIAIRTAVQKDDQITFHVGSGIVADSIPQHEYEETLHKAAGILAASG
ncbi:MAG: chorismate-binding protein [Prosthecobacter sp.]|nr:chorismate-binding protein [Prosthecobacter sp.]